MKIHYWKKVLHIEITWLFLWIRELESIKIAGISNVSILSEGIFRVILKSC